MKKHIKLNGLVLEVKPLPECSDRRKYHGQLCSYEELTNEAIQHQLKMAGIMNRIVSSRYKQ